MGINRAKINKTNKTDLFPTPEWIVEEIKRIAIKHGLNENSKVFDPCCGPDKRFESIIQIGKWDSYDILNGYDYLRATLLDEYDFAIINPPYKEQTHVKFINKLLTHCKKVVAIVPNMYWNNHAKKIIDWYYNPKFKEEFKIQTSQLSIFVFDRDANFKSSIREDYLGEFYPMLNRIKAGMDKPISTAPIYEGQKNAIVFDYNQIWASDKIEKFLITEPSEKQMFYQQNSRFRKKGEKKALPCIIYNNEDEKNQIIKFYTDNYQNFRKEIRYGIEKLIPLWTPDYHKIGRVPSKLGKLNLEAA